MSYTDICRLQMHKGTPCEFLQLFMTVLPTILRACVIGVASIVPENSPLDNVVFRSSLQILLGVVYVIIFYVVTALVRVLTGRTALMDPTVHAEHDFDSHQDNIEDIYQYSGDEDIFPKSGVIDPFQGAHTHESGMTESVDSSGLIVRVGQDVERRVRKIASVVSGLSVVPSTDKHTDIACVDDHSPAQTRRGSVDGVFSDASDDSQLDMIAGVSSMRQSCTRSIYVKGAAGSETNLNDISLEVSKRDKADHLISKNVNSKEDTTYSIPRSPRRSFPKRKSSSRSYTYTGGVPQVVAQEESLYIRSDRVYTDVYGLGFSAFVLHYTMDCSSMQPTLFLLIGLTCLGARDVSCIALSVKDNLLPKTTLFTRALTVFAFILLVSAQICMLVGIARVPSYHTDARDGSITEVPAPETILEHFLARVLPILAPLALYMVSKRTSVAANVSKTLRRAMPTTVLIALWFLTCFGAMSERIRAAVGAISVNATVTELSETNIAINMELPLLILSPFVKIPALLAIVSCCLTRKTMDVVAALCIVFYAKQLNAVREIEMRQMLCSAFVFACLAWFSLTLRYCSPIVRYVASFFDKTNTTIKTPKAY